MRQTRTRVCIHRSKFNPHSSLRLGIAHDACRAHDSAGNLKNKLKPFANRWWLVCLYEKTPQPNRADAGDGSLAVRAPSHV